MTTYKVKNALRKSRDSLIEALPLIVPVVLAVLWMNSAINSVRTELNDLERRLDTRIDRVEQQLASVEGKLDILIQGLNISVGPATTERAVAVRPDEYALSRWTSVVGNG